MRVSKPVLAVSVMFLLFLATPVAAFAQFSANQATDFIWVKTLGFERSWLNEPKQIILQVIVPSFAIFVITLGFVRTIKIFEDSGNVEYGISIVITLAALFMGWIGWVSSALAFLGFWVFVLFFIMFLVGIYLYAKGWTGSRRDEFKVMKREYKHTMKALEHKESDIDRKIWEKRKKQRNLLSHIGGSRSEAERRSWERKVEDIEDEIIELESKESGIRRAKRTAREIERDIMNS